MDKNSTSRTKTFVSKALQQFPVGEKKNQNLTYPSLDSWPDSPYYDSVMGVQRTRCILRWEERLPYEI